MIPCSVCGNEATFDSPGDLCNYHWAEWWVAGLEPATKEEWQELMEVTLEVASYEKI